MPSFRVERAQSASTDSTSSGSPGGPGSVAGVRENRGAGAACGTPSGATTVPRALTCGWSATSPSASTGVTQASVPSKTATHSSRVRARERLGEPGPQRRPAGDVVLGGQRRPGRGRARRAAARRTAAPAGRRRRGARRRRCRCRSRARRRRAGWPPARRAHWPCPWNAQIICISRLVPSTMAASTTWPRPDARASQQRGEDTDQQQHGAAAEVADEVQRQHRPVAGPADRVQGAGERDVVDVVAGVPRQRPVLAPAGHPAVDQPRVAGVAVGRPDPEALGDARPVALDQHVRVLDQTQHAPPGRRGP